MLTTAVMALMLMVNVNCRSEGYDSAATVMIATVMITYADDDDSEESSVAKSKLILPCRTTLFEASFCTLVSSDLRCRIEK